jgi:hypothetical protein
MIDTSCDGCHNHTQCGREGDPIATCWRPKIVKRCACGRTHTRAQFLALEPCGTQIMAEFGELLHLRNCQCGSTLAMSFLTRKQIGRIRSREHGALL